MSPAPAPARRLVAGAAALATAAGLLLVAPAAVGSPASSAPDGVAASPPGGVPGVAVPDLAWGACPADEPAPPPITGTFECATATVPLDYDDPTGETIELALKRRLADEPSARVGSLFLNPGGPGGSGVDFVTVAELFYDPEVLAAFDVVGFDPRGIARSTPLTCFASLEEVEEFYADLPPFPVTVREDRQVARAYEGLGRLCAERGGPVKDHMTTADVARDLDVLREAVGDEQLTYAGYSYGTQLGTTYANMFPGRVRALVLDAVLDPIAWTTGRNALEGRTVPFSTRLRSDSGAYATLQGFFRECRAAGPEACPLAEGGDPERRYARLALQLLVRPVEVEVAPGVTQTVGYAELVGTTLGALYDPPSWPFLAALVDELAELRDPRAAGAAWTAVQDRLGLQEEPAPQVEEGFLGVACSDSDNPRHWQAWSVNGRVADLRAPYFGRLWTWASIGCESWPVRDADRYAGPWTATTANPVLVVNPRYDPATRYEGAQLVNRLLPGSRLLTLEGYGHTTLAQSACVDAAVAGYLVDGVLPEEGATCAPDAGPFDAAPATRTADPRELARQEARREVVLTDRHGW
ncbi:alpha/beta hydrolase [Thalassiella azotivora]